MQICSGETMPEEDWSDSVQLKAGTAEYWFGRLTSSAANALTAVTCDGRVLLLVRCESGATRLAICKQPRFLLCALQHAHLIFASPLCD